MKKTRLITLRAARMQNLAFGKLLAHHRLMEQRREAALKEDLVDTQVLPAVPQDQDSTDVIDELADITSNLIFIGGLLVLTCAAVIILFCLGQGFW